MPFGSFAGILFKCFKTQSDIVHHFPKVCGPGNSIGRQQPPAEQLSVVEAAEFSVELDFVIVLVG